MGEGEVEMAGCGVLEAWVMKKKRLEVLLVMNARVEGGNGENGDFFTLYS